MEQSAIRRIALSLAWLVCACVSAPRARAEGPAPSPQPSTPEAAQAAAIEERFKALESRYEAMERRHAQEYNELARKYDELRKQVKAVPAQSPTSGDAPRNGNGNGNGSGRGRGNGSGAGGLPPTGGDDISEGGEGELDNPLPFSRPGAATKGETKLPVKVTFGPGFDLSTEDDEYQLQFHVLSQIDARLYEQTNQDPVHSGFSFPRERLYFMGRLTKPIEYYLTINRGYGTLDLLDSFINFHYDDRFMLKVGRFKTPFSYEFYAISAPNFLTPDRSLFQSNFSPNRQMGLMAWGQFFEKRLDYAVGIFNGNRFSFQDFNEPKVVTAYLNARPFEKNEGTWAFLKQLNVGGSVDYGNEQNPPQPSVLRTSIPASNAGDALNIAPPFLAYNRNVVQDGFRSFWGLHAAYFYKHLSVIAEWNSGYDTYSHLTRHDRTRVAEGGYYVAAGYFLTGEEVERRGTVRPIRPFKPKRGEFGLGAIEMFARYSTIDLGPQIFTAGFADPNLWTNHATTIDLGANWYLNEFTKIVLCWEHAEFGQPVYYRPGGLQQTSDLFWARFQVFY